KLVQSGRLLFSSAVPRGVLAVERQRLHGLAGYGVLVAVLLPAVEDEEPVPFPPLRRRRQAGRVELQPDRVAPLEDHVAIVGGAEELADVAVPRVPAGEIRPPGGGLDVIVQEEVGT